MAPILPRMGAERTVRKMIPMDKTDKWLLRLDQSAKAHLRPGEYVQYEGISKAEREAQVMALLAAPVANFTVINEVFFRDRWAEVMDRLSPGEGLTLLEVASGDADMIPQCMALLRPGSIYTTANMNEKLNESLMRKIGGLPVKVRLIKDDAANILSHMEEGRVDIIAFQHAVNDVLQAILCAQNGIDTVYSDWMETLPGMIGLLQKEEAEGTFEKSVKEPFLNLMRSLLLALKKGGHVAISHYMFQLDLDWGYPPRLFEQLVPIVREWLKELEGIQEVTLDGFDPQWWIFLKKTQADSRISVF